MNFSANHKALLYGFPSNAAIEHANRVKQMFSNGYEWLSSRINTITDKYFSSEVLQSARDALYRTSTGFHEDFIGYVTTESYQPNLLVARYLMANPRVWEERLKGRSDDFGGTYIDYEPDIKQIEDRDDYMQVMNGILKHSETGGSASQYLHLEDKLSSEEQATMLHNWDTSNALFLLGLDPTARK